MLPLSVVRGVSVIASHHDDRGLGSCFLIRRTGRTLAEWPRSVGREE